MSITPSKGAREAAALMIEDLDGHCDRACIIRRGDGDTFVEAQAFAAFEAALREEIAGDVRALKLVATDPLGKGWNRALDEALALVREQEG